MSERPSPYGEKASELLEKLVQFKAQLDPLLDEAESLIKDLPESAARKMNEAIEQTSTGTRRMRMVLRG